MLNIVLWFILRQNNEDGVTACGSPIAKFIETNAVCQRGGFKTSACQLPARYTQVACVYIRCVFLILTASTWQDKVDNSAENLVLK